MFKDFIFKLAMTYYSPDNTQIMINAINSTDIRLDELYRSNTVMPVYTPHNGDLVFLTNGKVCVYKSNNKVMFNNNKGGIVTITVDEKYILGYGTLTKNNFKESVHSHRHAFKRYQDVKDIITREANAHSVPREVLASLLFVESLFNNNAKSHTGVRGIAMITRDTALHYDVDTSTIESSIAGMAYILRHHYDELADTYISEDNKWRITSISYNRGTKYMMKGLHKYGDDITYKQFINYFKKFRYMNEGLDYNYKVHKYSQMFKGEQL